MVKTKMPHRLTSLNRMLAVLKSPSLAADLSGQPDLWAEVKRLAEIHRFSGVLAHSTSSWLKASERPWRDQVLMTHHRRHQIFIDQLRRLIDAFRAEDLPCVVLKGPLLAERVHPVPFLKLSHDLDLLVKRSDIPATARLMERLGFSLSGNLPWSVHQECAHDLQFTGNRQVRTVEVHFALKAGPRVIPAEEFISRAVDWHSVNGFQCRILSPSDEGFYLIVHAAGHAFHRLRWLYDALAQLKTLNASDRARVRALAIETDITGYFFAADLACREFFGEPLPLDLSGFSRPWLWSALQSRHLHTMAQREDYSFALRALDVCRISGSPASALQLCLQNGRGKLSTLLYRLRGGATGPEILAKTIQLQG